MGALLHLMERGDGLLEKPMTNVEVRAAVKAQKAAAKQAKLTYRGVSYLKAMPNLGN